MKPILQKWIKQVLFFSSSVIVCVSIIYLSISLFTFPNTIRVLEGNVYELNYQLPFELTMEQEAVHVLNTSALPLKERLSSQPDITPVESNEMSLNLLGMPLKKVTLEVIPDIQIVPCGLTVGVSINTDGLMVLGTDAVTTQDGLTQNPCGDILKSGDTIISINNQTLDSKEQFLTIVQNSKGTVQMKIRRDGKAMDVKVTPVQSGEDNKPKLGVWVRDNTLGIGTLTYYNPDNNKFAALGHGIIDIDTKQLMTVKTGEIVGSEITTVKMGKKGSPGELIGEIYDKQSIGTVKNNTPSGIFGFLDASAVKLSNQFKKPMGIALQNQVHEGPAKIRSTVENDTVKEYDVYIESVRKYSPDDSRGMILRITDPELLARTNGIVQGMSGSPIIQDDKVVGAVTHVFVQDPSKGYGIFIENMLQQERLI